MLNKWKNSTNTSRIALLHATMLHYLYIMSNRVSHNYSVLDVIDN